VLVVVVLHARVQGYASARSGQGREVLPPERNDPMPRTRLRPLALIVAVLTAALLLPARSIA
jgi:hypothetical protein